MTLSKTRFAAIVLFCAIFFGVIGAGTALAVQTHMVNAKHDLETALNELNSAQANKSGHRVNAINFVKQAINEVNLGIQAAE
ncbi:MAG TPA: hypothetical protein VIX83_00265 [Candidatus Cybelea sp.]